MSGIYRPPVRHRPPAALRAAPALLTLSVMCAFLGFLGEFPGPVSFGLRAASFALFVVCGLLVSVSLSRRPR